MGSRGIHADFVGKAIGIFQELLAKRLAALEAGVPGARGPVALRQTSQMMLTEIQQGSFGIVLEEVEENGELTDTGLHLVVHEVTDVLTNIAGAESGPYEAALESLDDRQLKSLRGFFELLDDVAQRLSLLKTTEMLCSIDRRCIGGGFA